MDQQKTLVLIVGPTAVGKTELCIELAKALDTHIFSCDSRQFYREMSIGTAKPTTEELAQIPHHFIDNLSIEKPYTVADFEKEFMAEMVSFFSQKNTAILTGGSGLFVRAITHGFDAIPDIPEVVRQDIEKQIELDGFDTIVQELKRADPVYCISADMANKQRVIRALQVFRFTQIPISEWKKREIQTRPFHILKIALERPREELYDRINKRVDLMMEQGLLEEVKKLEKYKNVNALNTVGYKELFAYLDNHLTKAEAVELIKRNTRRYAKRQLTWFKNQDEFEWFHPEQKAEILQYILQRL